MPRAKKPPSPSVVLRATAILRAKEALEQGQLPAEEDLAFLLPLLEFLSRTGEDAIDLLQQARDAVQASNVNSALKTFLLFDLARWPHEPSEDVREKIMADAKQAVRGKPMDPPPRGAGTGGPVVGGRTYGISDENPYRDQA